MKKDIKEKIEDIVKEFEKEADLLIKTLETLENHLKEYEKSKHKSL